MLLLNGVYQLPILNICKFPVVLIFDMYYFVRVIIFSFSDDMELDLPSNYQQVVLTGMKSAGKLWGSGLKSRLIVNPVKLQAAVSQLKPSMFSDDKYDAYDYATAMPIGGNGFL